MLYELVAGTRPVESSCVQQVHHPLVSMNVLAAGVRPPAGETSTAAVPGAQQMSRYSFGFEPESCALLVFLVLPTFQPPLSAISHPGNNSHGNSASWHWQPSSSSTINSSEVITIYTRHYWAAYLFRLLTAGEYPVAFY